MKDLDHCTRCGGAGYLEFGKSESTCPECLGTGADEDPPVVRYARHMSRGEWFDILGAIRASQKHAVEQMSAAK